VDVTTVADRWTKIFGGKASELETSRPVEKRNFALTHVHLAPLFGVIPSEFRRYLLYNTTSVHGVSCGVDFEILCLAVLIQYWLVKDGRTDRRTDMP